MNRRWHLQYSIRNKSGNIDDGIRRRRHRTCDVSLTCEETNLAEIEYFYINSEKETMLQPVLDSLKVRESSMVSRVSLLIIANVNYNKIYG